ncbi:hypothetical protein chiPu_0024476 [Chiloscyllium punctatum]|uniref:Uncharacterized protein n=1 Tax=Chiloscyllium punctatum TaxID=137246 RepID=A0A401TDM0_CHIPU|nr:hypothetical protein [Chiloscyllium punctatum]
MLIEASSASCHPCAFCYTPAPLYQAVINQNIYSQTLWEGGAPGAVLGNVRGDNEEEWWKTTLGEGTQLSSAGL